MQLRKDYQSPIQRQVRIGRVSNFEIKFTEVKYENFGTIFASFYKNITKV